MGKLSRDKGARKEREVVHLCKNAGIHAERVPLSGAMEFRNTRKTDVDVYANGKDEPPYVCEVKARKSGEGFVTIENWLGDADALFLCRDRKKPLVVLPFERFIELANKGREEGGSLGTEAHPHAGAIKEIADEHCS